MLAILSKSWVSLGKIIVVLLGVGGVGAFVYFDLGQVLSLTFLQENRDDFRAFTAAHYAQSVLWFVLTYIVVTGLCLPGGLILTLTGGFLFGSVGATFFVNIGATTGATLAFLAARYLFRDWVERTSSGKLGQVQAGFLKHPFSYLMTLRLIPLFPFFLVNMAAGLTRIRVGSFIGATALGIIPGSFIFAYAGQQLGSINSLREIVSPSVLVALTLLGLLAMGPIFYQKVRNEL